MDTRITSGELARRLGGELKGRDDVAISSPASFEDAGENDVCFYDGKDAGALASSGAGCIITSFVPREFKALSLVIIPEVRLGWTKALSAFPVPEEESSPSLVYVAESALVADSARLMPFTYIGPYVEIGAGSEIGPNVTVHSRTRIGRDVKIGAGSVIGSPGFGYVTDRLGNHHAVPHIGRVVIEDNVNIGAGVSIDRGTVTETRIGEGTKIDNLVHIAHNVRIGKRCLIAGQCGIAGSSILEDNVTLAGQVGVKDHVRIGAGAVVLAKSAVFKDIEAGSTVSGIPARPHRLTLQAQARLLRDVESKNH